MACDNPFYAVNLGKYNDKAKLKIFSPKSFSYSYLCSRYGKDNVIMLPCGHCPGCITNRSRSWAARCCIEANQYGNNNCFITLTYDDKHYPNSMKLVKRDLQLFFKRLRKKYGAGIKYFACGEYGSTTHRRHAHAIVFNWRPFDMVYISKGKHEGCYYKSKELDLLWSNGLTELGEVSFQSCAYVARYCQKKLLNNLDKDEFTMMSNGIGKSYFEEHKESMFETDLIYGNFGTFKTLNIPRYYEKLMQKNDDDKEHLEKLKEKRIAHINVSTSAELLKHGIDRVEKLNAIRMKDKLEKFKKLKRKGD